MADGQIFFGTVSHPQWVQCPGGLQRVDAGHSEEIQFTNGGVWVEESAASHAEFEMDFPVATPGQYDGVEAIGRFASREYGPGYLYWVDPMWADGNLFDPRFAAPGLIEQGWKNFGGNKPTFSNTGANVYGKPSRKATWTIDSAANAVFGKAFTFLIPPTHTLWLGGSGAVTGTGVLRVLPAGGAASTIALSTDAAAPAFTTSVLGSAASSATVYLARTSTAASTATLTALWAQILPTGQTPVITRHLPGHGTTGLRFRGKVLPEQYISAATGQKLIGMSVSLAEVEAWE